MKVALVLAVVASVMFAVIPPALSQNSDCWVDWGVVQYSYYSGPVPNLVPGDRLTVRAQSERGDCHVVIVDFTVADSPRSYVAVGEVSATVSGEIPGEVWVEYHFPGIVAERRGKMAMMVNGECIADLSFLRGGGPLSTPTPAPTIVHPTVVAPTHTPTPTLAVTPTPTPTLRLVLERLVCFLPLIRR